MCTFWERDITFSLKQIMLYFFTCKKMFAAARAPTKQRRERAMPTSGIAWVCMWDLVLPHALFGHTRRVRFIRPSIRTLLYIQRLLIDNFARNVPSWSLTKLLRTRLAKITVFLHISYNCLCTCHPSSPKFEPLKIVQPGRWKSVKDLPSDRVQYYPECQGFYTFFIFQAKQF